MPTTTQYIKPLLKKYGYRYGHVERFIHQRRITLDFQGFADVLAYRPFEEDTFGTHGGSWLAGEHLFPVDPPYGEDIHTGVLAIQGCAASGLNEHCLNYVYGKPAPYLRDWLRCGNRFEVWGWASRPQKPGSKRKVKIPTVRKFRWHQGHFYYYNLTELQHYGYELDPRYNA